MKPNFRDKNKIMENAYKVYNYLNEYEHVGKERGQTREVVAWQLSMDGRDLRKAMQVINESGEFEKLVSTSHSVYLCATDKEENEAIYATFKPAISLIKKARAMIKKKQSRGQMCIPLDETEYDEIVGMLKRGK